jgi:hypothetical protein
MDGAPCCSLEDLERPRLRQCIYDPADINWTVSFRIGGGLDGYLWKVWFGDRGPYVMKVVGNPRLISPPFYLPDVQFWDAEPPPFIHYFAAQRECQNAALLQMMEAAVEEAASGVTPPVLVNPRPQDRADALRNTLAFSNEKRQAPETTDINTLEISSMPRMKKCHGWLRLSNNLIQSWPKPPETLRVGKITRQLSGDKEYIAIIYEYIDEGENKESAVEQAAEFLWRVGFGYTMSSAARNWKSGVLVDLSDIVHASGYGWHPRGYGPRSADKVLRL